MDEDKLRFRTSDLALASALIATGFAIDELEKSHFGKASFVFIRSDSLDKAVSRYWADRLRVNPKAYFDVIKHLKTRIYSEA